MKVRRLLAFGVIIVGLMALGVSLVPLVNADPNAPEAILAIPTDDTYVLEADNTTHGTEPTLEVILNCQSIPPFPSYIAFLKFPMPDASATYRLVLSNTAAVGIPDVALYGVTNTTWTETGAQPAALDWFDLGDFEAGGTVFYRTNLLGTRAGVPANTLIEFNSATIPQLKTYIDTRRGLGDLFVAFALEAASCPVTFPRQAFASKEHPQGPPPLNVELASSALTAGNAWVEVTWTTASETDNEGFNIHRSESADGGFVKINDALIAARGNAATGATYTFTDEGINNGVTYYYRLEAVSTDGGSKFFDLGSATPQRPGKGR